jgi:hypothetical protein
MLAGCFRHANFARETRHRDVLALGRGLEPREDHFRSHRQVEENL